MDYQRLSDRAKKLMRLSAAVTALISLAAFAATGYFALVRNGFFYTGIFVICSGLLFALLIFIFVPKFRFIRYKYLIAADRIEIIEGVFFISRIIVPIDRIYQINVRKGPIDVLFKVAKVTVITAGSTATFRFLEDQKADELALLLNEHIAKKLRGEPDSDV